MFNFFQFEGWCTQSVPHQHAGPIRGVSIRSPISGNLCIHSWIQALKNQRNNVILFNPFQPEFPLQAANCCRNSRLVVDEDDLMWFKIKEKYHVLVNQLHGNFRSNILGCREIKSVFRDVK